MLKSTHRPAIAEVIPLPEGWTEHKAPTGHSYFYNSVTKESTYTRPLHAQQLAPQVSPLPGQFPGPGAAFHNGFDHHPFSSGHFSRGRGNHRGGLDSHQRNHPPDRPKSKITIPGCDPWVLVKTKLGRRFVHNPESGESFWRFPQDVMKGVVEFDKIVRGRKTKAETARAPLDEDEEMAAAEAELSAADDEAPTAAVRPIQAVAPDKPQPLLDSDGEEYEEVEVTDDEDEENPSKRHKTDEGEPEGPVEFNEDDIAYQLAAMGQDYGLDPGEYDDGGDENDLQEGAEGLPLTEEDSSALFKDMLDDYQISPYTLWDKIVEAGQIIEDDRYTVLPNMRTRKEVFGAWSRERIQRLKEQRATEEKKDLRIPYFAFLEAKAMPKLYWPEFRRKYQKEPEMRNTKISDKDREKWYREYINRLKLPESTLKSDLISLLKSTPLHALNRSSGLDALSATLLTDLRYISLRSSVRDPLMEAHISTLPEAPIDLEVSPEEEAARAKDRRERERRENALAERQRKVEEEKRKQRGALQHSKGVLREEEQEIQRAMQIGKEGLLGHMKPDEKLKT